ncbi:MAG: hypothetical protein AAF587_27630 [Bacteroidota bacterium]
MKTYFLPLLLLLSLSSCQLIDIAPEPENPINCSFITEITPPSGVRISKRGVLDPDFKIGLFDQLQVINEQLAYALGSTNIGGYVGLMKSTDSGMNWDRLEIEFDFHPRSMAFRDAQFGLIIGSQQNVYQNNTLRTTDGGKSWERLTHENLPGLLYHLQFDKDGNIYAYLTDHQAYKLVKSTDNGESWHTLFDSPDLEFKQVTFGYRLVDEHLYISGKEGKLLKINTNGDLLEVLETGVAFFQDVYVIDEDNLIVTGSHQAMKSSDGGKSWTIIHDRSSKVVGYTSSQNGLLILNLSHCPTDVGPANDLFASTNDGGISWDMEEVSTNLLILSSNSQPYSDRTFWMIIDHQLLEISMN